VPALWQGFLQAVQSNHSEGLAQAFAAAFTRSNRAASFYSSVLQHPSGCCEHCGAIMPVLTRASAWFPVLCCAMLVLLCYAGTVLCYAGTAMLVLCCAMPCGASILCWAGLGRDVLCSVPCCAMRCCATLADVLCGAVVLRASTPCALAR
jgi:hypothetical protein